MSVVQPGQAVPDFTLRREDDQPFGPAHLHGQTSVLVFYPFAFSPVCTDQLTVYQQKLGEFEAQGATLYGVSCDSTYTQRAFRDSLDVAIEQLSDFEPKGAACRAFGVYHEGGFPHRALVITARDGTIKWSYQAPSPGDLPPAELIFEGLAA